MTVAPPEQISPEKAGFEKKFLLLRAVRDMKKWPRAALSMAGEGFALVSTAPGCPWKHLLASKTTHPFSGGLTDAYERILQKLSLIDRNDPLIEIITKKVIELAQRGVRDAGQLSELAIKELWLEL